MENWFSFHLKTENFILGLASFNKINLINKKRLCDFLVCFVLTDGGYDTSVPPPHKVAVVTYPVAVVA